jgi:MFS family permease
MADAVRDNYDFAGMQTEARPTAAPTPAPDLPIADLIGRGLIERHYGSPYDPAGIHVRDTAVEMPIDLRDGPDHPSRRDTRARWRAFRAYWVGHLCSMVGDHLTLVALPLAAAGLTHSGIIVGLIVSAETLATVLFGTATGTLTDRRHPRPLMISADLLRAVILAMIAVLNWRHMGSGAALITAAFIMGMLRLVHDGAESSMIARLIPNELDVRSNARLTLSENIGMTIGPLLAGAATTIGLWLAFGADAVTFVLAAMAVAFVGRASRRRHIDTPAREDEREPRQRFRSEFGHAFRLIRRNRPYARALTVMALINIAALPLGPQFVTIARDQLHLSPFVIGLVFAVGGLAGVIAAPIIGRSATIRPSLILLGGAVMSAGILVVGARPSIWTILLSFLLAGVGLAAATTHYAAMRQRMFAPSVQGRVTLTSRMILWSILPVGAVVGGWLSDAVDPAAMWLACGAVGLAAVLWGAIVGLGRLTVR